MVNLPMRKDPSHLLLRATQQLKEFPAFGAKTCNMIVFLIFFLDPHNALSFKGSKNLSRKILLPRIRWEIFGSENACRTTYIFSLDCIMMQQIPQLLFSILFLLWFCYVPIIHHSFSELLVLSTVMLSNRGSKSLKCVSHRLSFNVLMNVWMFEWMFECFQKN